MQKLCWKLPKEQEHIQFKYLSDSRKHGLDEFVQANPAEFDHHELFQLMQILTLDYRLNDAYTCLVSKSNNE
jgi:hypothetical protein